MQKTSRLNRLLAVLVAVFMAVCCLPLNAFADGETSQSELKKIVVLYENSDFETVAYGPTLSPSDTLVLTDNLLDGYNGENLKGWNYEGSYLGDKGTTLTFDQLKEKIGDRITPEGESYMTLIAVYKPAEPEYVTFKIHFQSPEGAEYTEYSYNTTGGDIGMLTAEQIAVPEGYTLENWQLEGTNALLAPGTNITTGELQTALNASAGETIDVYFTAVFKQNTVEPQEKALTTLRVHFVDKNLNDLADSYTLTGGDVMMPTANEVTVPEGSKLLGWTLLDYGQNLYAPGTNLTFGELKTVVGDSYDKQNGTADLYFYVQLQENVTAPEEKPLTTLRIHFVDKNLNDLADSYTLTGGDVMMPTANEVTVPEGSKLLGWTLRDYGQNLYAPGTNLTFGELKTVVGDGYDKQTGMADLYFYIVCEGDTQTVGLNFYDETSEEQVCEAEVELPADAIHMNTNDMLDYLPEGYDFVVTGDLAINDGWIYVGVKPTKTLRIYWAIDDGENADFANGNADMWTQELTWKHINDEITMPEVTVADGYVLNGWTVGGQKGEFWAPELKTMKVGDKFVTDEKGGAISITANIVKEADKGSTGNGGSTGSSDNNSSNNSNNNTTTTATSTSSKEVVKASAPADNTVKILPQTGISVETPVVFGGMLFAALAGAGAYLFVMRKKLNQTF